MERTTDSGARPARQSRAGGTLLGIVTILLLGCGPSGAEDDAPVPDRAELAPADRAGVTLLLRGRIRPDTLVLEPVFLLDRARPVGQEPGGRHRVVGLDRSGAVVFDIGVDGAVVADAEGPEEHFQRLISITEDEAARLHRVELRVSDGRIARRTTAFSTREFEDVLEKGNAVSARRTAGGQVRLAWADDHFPEVMVVDPQTGQVLAFGRSGQLTLTTDRDTLEVTVSDGVRSGNITVRVR